MYNKKRLKNDRSIEIERINCWNLPLIIKLRLLSGKNPPDEINVNDKLKESKILTPDTDNNKKIIIVSIRYIELIFKDCFKVSLLLNEIKFVSDFFKLVSKISINKINEIKKYNPPTHWVEDLQRIKLWFKCFKFSNTVKPVEVNPETDSKYASNKLKLFRIK